MESRYYHEMDTRSSAFDVILMTKNDILLNGSACLDKAQSKNIENQLIIDIENNSDREKLQNQVAQIANVTTISHYPD